jgi:hypothetical protein
MQKILVVVVIRKILVVVVIRKILVVVVIRKILVVVVIRKIFGRDRDLRDTAGATASQYSATTDSELMQKGKGGFFM